MRCYTSLRGRREFALVLRRGRAASAKHLVVLSFSPPRSQTFDRGRTKSTAPRESSPRRGAIAKVGIIITKKVGKAVVRNLLRRRCKAILDKSAIANGGKWYVVQFRPAAAQLSYAQLREQLLQALAQCFEQAGTRLRGPETARS